jgi:acetyl esterase/lipase
MRSKIFATMLVVAMVGCNPNQPESRQPDGDQSKQDRQKTLLNDARKGFKTTLTRKESARTPVPLPPPNVFRLVHFESPVGKLAALLSPDPKDGKKHPAIIWITGGDCNSIDASVWQKGPDQNEQSASAFREAGIPMMFPTLRGGNNNPSVKESFLGEVDDVLAAADFLRKQDFIDPSRIYLGGHSTGGSLVFLVAACSDKFRAVFSFGPADEVSGYGPDFMPFNTNNAKELELRSPGRWMHSIQSPTFVFEGTLQPGNLDALRTMQRGSSNTKLHFYPVNGANHFSILAPTNRLIASKILADTGPTVAIEFAESELSQPFQR